MKEEMKTGDVLMGNSEDYKAAALTIRMIIQLL